MTPTLPQALDHIRKLLGFNLGQIIFDLGDPTERKVHYCDGCDRRSSDETSPIDHKPGCEVGAAQAFLAAIEAGKGDEPKSVIGPMCSHCGLSMVQFAPAEGNLIGGWACPSMGLHPISAPSAAPAVEADVRSLVLSCLAHTGMRDEDANRILAEINVLTAHQEQRGEGE